MRDQVRKVGVEEELMLVDPDSAELVGVSSAAVQANDSDTEVAQELFLEQIETSTSPVETADDLLRAVREGRRAVGAAAAAAGSRAVAVAAPVLRDEHLDFTDKPRYRKIEADYGETARSSLVAAMHMHVDVVDDAEGVRVIDRVRPWLPVLLALSANSPYWQGRDTGYASWRSQLWGRWPTGSPNEPFGDVATYRAVTDQMQEWGGAMDAGMLYFDIRLSHHLPTVEIRVADVTTDLEDVVLVAMLARALVATAAVDAPTRPWRSDLLRVASWRAAKSGLTDELVHPEEATVVPARTAVEAAVAWARPALEEAGDLELVVDGFERLMARGGGATRQRRVLEEHGDLRAVVEDLARRTEESWVVG